MRGDGYYGVEIEIDDGFQSTPPREGRHNPDGAGIMYADGFNPRPRVRGDLLVDRWYDTHIVVSIHAPA